MTGYGTGVFIDHGIINGKHVISEYGHLSHINIKVGDYFTGLGYDLYNFDMLYKEYLNDIMTASLNNSAKFWQAIGHLKNYYIFVPTKIKL